MPSGRKKRKATKKKKVEEGNNSTFATHSHGDDNLKNHDGKESDGGEVSSPASQDHHNHQHPFTEGEEEEEEVKREDNSSARWFVTENSSLEGVNYDGESTQKAETEEKDVVQIDRDLMSEEDFESNNIIIESAKESQDGGSSGSSSTSSSDDECDVLKKKSVVVETASPLYSDNLVDSLSEVVAQVNDSIPVGEVNHSVVETASVVESDDKLLEQVVHVNESASIDNPMTSGVVVESGLKENGEKKMLSLDENAEVSQVVMDLGSRIKDDEIVLASDENATASFDVIEDKLLMSFNAPRVDTSNGAEHVKDSETPELSDSQPLVASAPRTVQTTSWKSCCGIFELFTGSNT